MKKQITSWLLVLVLCLGLTVPAAAAEEKVTVGDKAYETVLDAILSEKEDKPVTVALSGDVALTAAVVLGESKVDDKTVTVASHNVTVDLNGYTLTGAKDSAVFEVQEGYTLTIVDNSEAKTGKLVSDAEEAVVVAEGATYNALPAGEEETPVEPEKPVNPFTDVAETSPYHDAILWAVEQGITQGYEDGTFRPGTTCSHIHILTFLWRAEGSPDAGDEAAKETLYATRWAVAENLLGNEDIHSGCTLSLIHIFVHIIPVGAGLLQKGAEFLLVVNHHVVNPQGREQGRDRVQAVVGGVNVQFQPMHTWNLLTKRSAAASAAARSFDM